MYHQIHLFNDGVYIFCILFKFSISLSFPNFDNFRVLKTPTMMVELPFPCTLRIYRYIDSYNHHKNEDTELYYHYKDPLLSAFYQFEV